MEHADILRGLFPAGNEVRIEAGLVSGAGRLPSGRAVEVVGLADGVAPGVELALRLGGRVLEVAAREDETPLLVMVDSASQRMSRRDELLGLSEYLAHLAKALRLASARGHRTVGLIHGGSAAGAFIATALATDLLAALPGARPEVMDLPSMARVTKLSLAVLEEKAGSTPVFAPGLDNLFATGAVHEVWDPGRSLGLQLEAALARPAAGDERARLGQERQGRPRAQAIAQAVRAAATAGRA